MKDGKMVLMAQPLLESRTGAYLEWYQSRLSRFHGRVCRSCVGMVRMAGVDPSWSHSMAHALALDIRTWPREDAPGLGLIDEDVGLLRG
jgi:hypothetical protein